MCLALYKPADIKPDWSALEAGMCHNSDGAGFAVAVDGQLIIEKGFFKFADFKRAFEPFGDHAAIVHFRLATHGGTNQQNCHPFALADFGNDAGHPPLAVIHNGIFSHAANDKKEWSDTWHVCRDELHPLWAKYGNCFGDPSIITLGDKFVGVGNKLVFLCADGTFAIWGEKNGHWSDGVWYSNYSYMSYGSKYADPRCGFRGGWEGYNDDDDYWSGHVTGKNAKKYDAPSEEDDGFEPVINYEVEATAIEQALVEELRECGYDEAEIERCYILKQLAAEVAAIYGLSEYEVNKAAKERAEADGLTDAEPTTDTPDIGLLPDDYEFVGRGRVTDNISGVGLDGSVMGWNAEKKVWAECVGLMDSVQYAVRRTVLEEVLSGTSPRAKRKLPDGFTVLGNGPVHGTQPLKDGDVLRWSSAYEKWSPCAGLMADQTYAVRIGCGAYIEKGGARISSSVVPKLKLETGERYLTRDGRTTGPLLRNADHAASIFPFRGRIGDDPHTNTWKADGSFTNMNSSNDLVSRVELELQVGKRYVTRDGRSTSVVEASSKPDGSPSAFPFRAKLGSDQFDTHYAKNGRWMTNGKPHKHDLVAEFSGIMLEAGKRYVTRNGEVSKPINACVNGRHYAEFGKNLIRYYLPDGRFNYAKESGVDLVSEFAGILPVIGKSYTTNDGKRVDIVRKRKSKFFGTDGTTQITYTESGTAIIDSWSLAGEWVEPEPEPEYRELEMGETIRYGDEFAVGVEGKWHRTSQVGQARKDPNVRYRRPVTDSDSDICGEGYRWLEENELIEEGDEYLNLRNMKWGATLAVAGRATPMTYRRKITSDSVTSELITLPQ